MIGQADNDEVGRPTDPRTTSSQAGWPRQRLSFTCGMRKAVLNATRQPSGEVEPRREQIPEINHLLSSVREVRKAFSGVRHGDSFHFNLIRWRDSGSTPPRTSVEQMKTILVGDPVGQNSDAVSNAVQQLETHGRNDLNRNASLVREHCVHGRPRLRTLRGLVGSPNPWFLRIISIAVHRLGWDIAMR